MLDRIVSQVWALESNYHNRMAGIALRRIDVGQAPFKTIKDEQRMGPYIVDVTEEGDVRPKASTGYQRLGKAQTKGGSVVVLPMIGAISRYGDMCSYGAEDYAGWILEMNADDNSIGAVLELNGPGGEVDGIEMLGEVIRQSKKPIVAYVAGWAASAHYWIASQCREIYVESLTTTSVGSIGVLAFHVDASGWYDQKGFKVTIIRSEGSDNKALFNDSEPLTDDIKASVQGELNIIRGTFIKKVKGGRPNITDAPDDKNGVFSGKMYHGAEAIKKGLADKVGYLGDAIARVDQLARQAA